MNTKTFVFLLVFAGFAMSIPPISQAQSVASRFFQCPNCGKSIGWFDTESAGRAALNSHLASCASTPRSQPQAGAVSGTTAIQQQLNQSAYNFGSAFGAWLAS